MNRICDFNWLVGDIDESIIFMLRDGKQMIGSYYVKELTTNGIESDEIRFANISDLTNFVNFTSIRFVDSKDDTNIIDIPLRNLKTLYSKTNEITKEEPEGIELTELDAFGVGNNHVLTHGYAIYAYKINEPSDELKEVMYLTNKFGSLSINEKINALEEINLINYQRSIKQKVR